jgi:hypothetical protein
MRHLHRTALAIPIVGSMSAVAPNAATGAPRYRRLPPGLQKKLRRGVFDGRAVIVNPRSGTIVDFTVLF